MNMQDESLKYMLYPYLVDESEKLMDKYGIPYEEMAKFIGLVKTVFGYDEKENDKYWDSLLSFSPHWMFCGNCTDRYDCIEKAKEKWYVLLKQK